MKTERKQIQAQGYQGWGENWARSFPEKPGWLTSARSVALGRILWMIRATVRRHPPPVRMAIMKDVYRDQMLSRVWGKRTPLYYGWEVNWCSHCGEQYGQSLKKRKLELSYDPAILFPDRYQEKTLNSNITCAPVLTAALFTKARRWEQPKCPPAEAWVKTRRVCAHTHVYKATWLRLYKEWTMPFAATRMDLEIIIQTEISPTKTNIVSYPSYVEFKKWYK